MKQIKKQLNLVKNNLYFFQEYRYISFTSKRKTNGQR